MQNAVSLRIPPQAEIAEKAIVAIEWMLTRAKVTAGLDGGLTWSIELDGHAFEIEVDRDGAVRSSTHS